MRFFIHAILAVTFSLLSTANWLMVGEKVLTAILLVFAAIFGLGALLSKPPSATTINAKDAGIEPWETLDSILWVLKILAVTVLIAGLGMLWSYHTDIIEGLKPWVLHNWPPVVVTVVLSIEAFGLTISARR
jgi:hypothetical protein